MRIIYILLLLSLITNCEFNTYEGKYGSSYSLQDSQNRDVFERLIFKDSLIKINDSFSLNIKNCFVESEWTYGAKFKNSRAVSGSQLIIECEENEFISTLNRKWILEEEQFRGNNPHGASRIGERTISYSEIGSRDTLNFIFLKGTNIMKNDSSYKNRILGKFDLVLNSK